MLQFHASPIRLHSANTTPWTPMNHQQSEMNLDEWLKIQHAASSAMSLDSAALATAGFVTTGAGASPLLDSWSSSAWQMVTGPKGSRIGCSGGPGKEHWIEMTSNSNLRFPNNSKLNYITDIVSYWKNWYLSRVVCQKQCPSHPRRSILCASVSKDSIIHTWKSQKNTNMFWPRRSILRASVSKHSIIHTWKNTNMFWSQLKCCNSMQVLFGCIQRTQHHGLQWIINNQKWILMNDWKYNMQHPQLCLWIPPP